MYFFTLLGNLALICRLLQFLVIVLCQCLLLILVLLLLAPFRRVLFLRLASCVCAVHVVFFVVFVQLFSVKI